MLLGMATGGFTGCAGAERKAAATGFGRDGYGAVRRCGTDPYGWVRGTRPAGLAAALSRCAIACR